MIRMFGIVVILCVAYAASLIVGEMLEGRAIAAHAVHGAVNPAALATASSPAKVEGRP